MLETLATALQASALSQSLRASIWLYPLVNTGHVVGIALVFGAIVPLDLRLLGCWRSVPLATLARVSVPVSVAGLLLALATGSLLFATRPLDYVGEPLFALKMALLAAALLNALLLRRSPAWPGAEAAPADDARTGVGPADAPRAGVDPAAVPRRALRIAGASSLALWLAVIAAGRLIGYR